MNYEVAILYAKQRMRELGKQPFQYHHEPVYVCPTADQETLGEFSVRAYNEIYILVNPENYFGLLILGDNSGFNSDNAALNGAPEFTGLIRFIKIADEWSLAGVADTHTGMVTGGVGDTGDTGGHGEGTGDTLLKYGFVEFLRVVIY